MATQTIYPFGPGGTLPESIAIVNDLTTGGADKALSAEMGKVLGEDITDIREAKDTISPVLSTKKFLNANADDAGYGTIVDVTNAIYSVTDYVDVSGYDSAELDVISGASATSGLVGLAGIIFYDETKNIISGIVTCTSTTASGARYQVSFPSGCRYIRWTQWNPGVASIFSSKIEGIGQRVVNAEKHIGWPVSFPVLQTSRYVDANEQSNTFGSVMSGVSSPYGVTDMIDVRGYDFAIMAIITGTGTAVIKTNGGYVFYDEQQNPICGVVTAKGAQGAGAQIIVPIPAKASYLRLTCWGDATEPVKLYKNNTVYAGQQEGISRLGSQTHIRSHSGQEYIYDGNKVELAHRMTVSQAYKTPSTQGCSVWGSYIFGYNNSTKEFYLLDREASVSAASVIKTWSVASVLGINAANFHGNTISMPELYVEDTDELPIILVSGNMSELIRKSHVLRCYNDTTNGWTLELRYTITNDEYTGWQLTAMRDGRLVGVVDAFAVLNIKIDPTRTTDQSITAEDILVPLSLIDGTLQYVAQGVAVVNNYLIMPIGYGTDQQPGVLKIYDLYTQRLVNEFILDELGITGEPEDVSVSDGMLYLSIASGNMWELNFNV